MDKLNIKNIEEQKNIIIKPNLCYYWDGFTTGQTTDPRIVSGLIDWIKERNDKANILIAESDASAMKTKYSFKVLGYDKLAREKNIELINLSKGEITEEKVVVDGETLF